MTEKNRCEIGPKNSRKLQKTLYQYPQIDMQILRERADLLSSLGINERYSGRVCEVLNELGASMEETKLCIPEIVKTQAHIDYIYAKGNLEKKTAYQEAANDSIIGNSDKAA